jgi:hypothetical protein
MLIGHLWEKGRFYKARIAQRSGFGPLPGSYGTDRQGHVLMSAPPAPSHGFICDQSGTVEFYLLGIRQPSFRVKTSDSIALRSALACR